MQSTSDGPPASQQPDTAPDRAPLPRDGFQEFLGFEWVSFSSDHVEARLDITAGLTQRNGIVHGGAFCALVEAAASRGAAQWWGDRGQVVGVSNQTDFLRPVRTGTLRATAAPLHRGETQQVWRVEITDQDGRMCASGQVRLQNLRPKPSNVAS